MTKLWTLLTGAVLALALIGCDNSPSSDDDASEQAAPEPEAQEEASDEAALEDPGDSILEIRVGEHRSEANRDRDRYRNPEETLFFFGLEPTDTVVEINPGGGWYMEIIAPYVNEEGQYIAAQPDPAIEGMPDYVGAQVEQIRERLESQPNLYGNGELRLYDPADPSMGEPGSADKVLTFRNTHNWVQAGQGQAMFDAFAEVLKPGGVLGVVQHRAEDDSPAEETASTGYISEQAVIEMAENAGLSLADRSNLNANPRDSRDHPEGVWTLPPTLRLGDENREEYEAIGESDRMTLKFVKPTE